jgi:predicted aspartyl protease
LVLSTSATANSRAARISRGIAARGAREFIVLAEGAVSDGGRPQTRAAVIENLNVSLLGMSSLGRLQGYEMRDAKLTISW